MPDRPGPVATALTTCCQQRCGEDLRSVVSYDADGYDCHYLREDVEAAYDRDQFADLVERAAINNQLVSDADTEETPLGPTRSVVLEFEGATVVQFPRTATAGFLVGLDRWPEAAFLRACQDCL